MYVFAGPNPGLHENKHPQTESEAPRGSIVTEVRDLKEASRARCKSPIYDEIRSG